MQIELGNRLDINDLYNIISRYTTPMDVSDYVTKEGKNSMEQIENQNPVELQVSPEEAQKLLQQLEAEGVVVTTDEAEPTDAERVLN